MISLIQLKTKFLLGLLLLKYLLLQEYKVEEAHKVATTSPPPAKSTTPSSLQLNMHMLSRTNQTFDSSSSKVEQTSATGRGPAVDVRGGSSRGGLEVRGGRRGARNRAAVRSGGRGLGGRLLRSRSDYFIFN